MRTLLLTLLLVPMMSFGQSKKKQIEALNFSLDSLNIVLSTIRTNSAKESKELNIKNNELIEEKKLLIEDKKELLNKQILSFKNEKLLNKKVDSLNSSLVKLSNENKFLKIKTDSIKQELTTALSKSKQDAKIVNFFERRMRSSPDFKTFFNAFYIELGLLDDFFEQYANSTEIISKYTNSKFGIGYYFNPGAYCHFLKNKDVEYSEEFHSGINLKTFKNLTIHNEKVVGGYCEPSKQEDGLYYSKVNRLPGYDSGSFDGTWLSQPFENYNIMSLDYMEDGFTTFTLYFIQDNDKKWYLTYIHTCDCTG